MPADPRTHHCDVGDVNYGAVKDGHLQCTVCRATWKLNPQRGWLRDPTPKPNTRRYT